MSDLNRNGIYEENELVNVEFGIPIRLVREYAKISTSTLINNVELSIDSYASWCRNFGGCAGDDQCEIVYEIPYGISATKSNFLESF